jgi:DNA topoisomerase VI subunit B
MASNRQSSRGTFERTTFSINRELEFFTEKELDMQIGHTRGWWPLALTKEMIDNGLDAAEMSSVPPVIEVRVDESSVSVRDNGPGVPTRTLDASTDYRVRVSDKA